MKSRIERLRDKFKELNIDAFLVTKPEKVRYLTGFNGIEETPCLVTFEEVFLIIPSRDLEQARQETGGCEIIVQPYSPVLFQIRAKNLIRPGWKIGVEGDVFFRDIYLLQNEYPECEYNFAKFPGSNFKDLVDSISAIKDKEEIRNIQRALRITEKVYQKHILPQVRAGITENDLASEITRWGKKYGAEKDAFDIIVASGKRAAIPHAFASPKKLEKGDIVQFDFGYVVDGYPSDFSRVVALGEPTEKQKEIHQIVLTAQGMAIKAVRPGMKCEDLDKVVRDYIKSKGYNVDPELGHGFCHALGHGLGIMIHCQPRLGPGEETELRPGQVVTIEPGIYIPGWGGIRLEDVVVITEKGCKNLTRFTKDLIVIKGTSRFAPCNCEAIK